jgi:hypothetical protein
MVIEWVSNGGEGINLIKEQYIQARSTKVKIPLDYQYTLNFFLKNEGQEWKINLSQQWAQGGMRVYTVAVFCIYIWK